MPGSSNLPVILQGSTGGNGDADTGKAAVFGAEGSLEAKGDAGTSALTLSTGVSGVSTALYARSENGLAVYASSGATTAITAQGGSASAPAIEVTSKDGGLAGDIAHLHNNNGLGMIVGNDGDLTWTSATGRTGSNNGLGWQEKYPSADVPVTGTTEVAVTGMSFAALTTKRYHITIVLRGASPAAGTKIGLYTSAGTGHTIFMDGLQGIIFFTLHTNAGLNAQGNTFWAATVANNTLRIDGSFVCGNADCTVDLRVSSNTAGQTTTIEEDGTYMRVFQAN